MKLRKQLYDTPLSPLYRVPISHYRGFFVALGACNFGMYGTTHGLKSPFELCYTSISNTFSTVLNNAINAIENATNAVETA